MNRQLIATGVLCFGLGFIAHTFLSPTSTPIPTSITSTAKQSSQPAVPAQVLANHQADQNKTLPPDNPIKQSASSAPINRAETNSNKDAPNAGVPGKLKFTQRTEISDESIDELVPKPFNSSIKHLQPELKTKFANYLLSETQTDAERQAENFLNDALNRGQLAGIAEVKLIGCKAGLCEVRLIEQAVNQTMPTVFKLMAPYRDYLQDTITSSTSDGEQVYIHYLYNIKPSP